MAHPLRRFASPPSWVATPLAWQSQFFGVCANCTPAFPASLASEK